MTLPEFRHPSGERLQKTRAEVGREMAKHLSGMAPEDKIDSVMADASDATQQLRHQVWKVERAALDIDGQDYYYDDTPEVSGIEIGYDTMSGQPLSLEDVEADPTLTANQKFELARTWLDENVDIRRYKAYADGMGPLTAKAVYPSIAQGEAFMQMQEELGWPESTDDTVLPPLAYSDDEFRIQLFEQPSRTLIAGEEGAKRNERALNNFLQFMRSKPIEIGGSAGLENVYGMMPFVRRANMMAPEFFQAVRIAANAFNMAEQDVAKERLAEPENAKVLAAMNMAYRIMGRLIKPNDPYTQTTSAHEELTR